MLKHDITDDKLKDMAQLKNLMLHILEKIHEKMNPQVVFSNVLGLLIKLAIIISLFKAVDEKNTSVLTEIKQANGTVVKGYSKGLSSDEKKRLEILIFKIIAEEIINFAFGSLITFELIRKIYPFSLIFIFCKIVQNPKNN